MQTNIFSKIITSTMLITLFNLILPLPVYAQDNVLPGNQTFGNSSGGGGIKNPLEGSADSVTGVLKRVINWMLGLVGFLALIALIIGGARMIMDFGNEEQVKKAKSTILWAVIGLAVVILSYAIINIVTTEILGTGGGPSATQRYESDPGTFL